MRILVTCPPMIGAQKHFLPMFDELGWEAVIPEFTQVMTESELCDLLPTCDGWIIGDDPATRAVFEAGKAGQLRAVVKWGVGVDNVDFDACQDLGLPVSNTPNMFGQEVADVAMGYVIGLARQLFEIDAKVRQGNWFKPQGQSLTSKKVGVVGYGDIGRNTCHRLLAFGMDVQTWDPSFKPEDMEAKVTHKVWPQGLEDCDYVVFTCALNEATQHMLNAQSLANCKVGVRIVNVARGPLIDETELLAALASGHVAAAALDVFEAEPLSTEHALLSMPNVLVGSHNGSNTFEGVMRATTRAIDLMRGFLSDTA
jgi:D-3-phosphoglycerate dehydrogenase